MRNIGKWFVRLVLVGNLALYATAGLLAAQLWMLFLVMLASLASLTVHELGHAAAALAVRARLREISIGSGRPLVTFKFFGCRLRIRMLLWGGGHVKTVCDTKRYYRTRRVVLLLSGVGAEVVYLAFLWVFRELHQIIGSTARIQIYVVGVSIVANLWPRNSDKFRNDGGQILDVLRMTEADVGKAVALADTSELLIETQELLETGRLDQLVQLTEGMDEHQLDTVDAKLVRANGLNLAGRSAESVHIVRLARAQLLTEDPANLDGLALLDNLLAYGLALIGDPATMDEAHALASSAFEQRPHPAIGATLGAVLVQHGDPKRGIQLLGPFADAGDTVGENFETLRLIFLGHLAMRDPLSARQAFLAARRLAGDRRGRIDDLLPDLGALEAAVWIGRMSDGTSLPSAAQLGKGRVVLGRALYAWMSPDLASDVRWQLYADMGGDRAIATNDRCVALRLFADSLLPTEPQLQAEIAA